MVGGEAPAHHPNLRVKRWPFLASKAVIFSINFTGPQILAVIEYSLSLPDEVYTDFYCAMVTRWLSVSFRKTRYCNLTMDVHHFLVANLLLSTLHMYFMLF